MYGVIDIGSNSVRLMLSTGEKTIKKFINVTRLAEGLCSDALLKDSAIERTARAVSLFKEQALVSGATTVYAFATAAVRRAKNGKAFTDRVKELCDLDVEVVSGELEAELGVVGALDGKDGGVIDIGGASTEIIVKQHGKIVYSHSLDLGVVRLLDLCGQDKDKLDAVILERIKEYGKIPSSTFYAIGGSATSMSAVLQALEPYDPSKVHGYKLTLDKINLLADQLFNMSVEQKRQLKGLQKERAEVIYGGVLLLLRIVQMLGVSEVIISESDNLEGYLIKKRG